MNRHALEADVITRVADDYRQRGYSVTVRPAGSAVPEFLLGYQPDLIARSDSDSVVVEVKVGSQTSVAERFRDVTERVNRQPGWRFSLVFVDPERPDSIREAPLPTLTELHERLSNAETLVQAGNSEAAFLLLWSSVEG